MYPPIHNAGAECMVHALNRFLLQNGWRITIILPSFPKTMVEGVHVLQFRDTLRIKIAIERASIIMSHLRFSDLAVDTAMTTGKPLVLVIHNSFQIPNLQRYRSLIPKNLYLIHNSHWIKDVYRPFAFHSHETVLYPPVFPEEFDYAINRKYVTLVNCKKEKGGQLLIDLAKRMPRVQFLGVLGAYGIQVTEDLPNLRYMKNTPNTRFFYSQTDILLIPSVYESWGRVAVEAMSLGIPVIATPTPGLKESLGDVGIFLDLENIDEWITTIKRLKRESMTYATKSEEGKRRAQILHPLKQLIQTEKWLSGISKPLLENA